MVESTLPHRELMATAFLDGLLHRQNGRGGVDELGRGAERAGPTPVSSSTNGRRLLSTGNVLPAIVLNIARTCRSIDAHERLHLGEGLRSNPFTIRLGFSVGEMKFPRGSLRGGGASAFR
jgi:hypothetical protein